MAQYPREQLEKLLKFLNDEVIHEPANAWFVDKLCFDLPKLNIGSSDNITLKDIKEYCIEEILKEQAEEFYKDFPIEVLKSQLIKDFVKMEMWRRRNNLQEFCLALYQQVENIVNFIANVNIVSDVVLALITAPAYLSNEAKSINERNDKSTYRIANLLFIKEAGVKAHKIVAEQLALDKFRIIYYFICKQGRIKANQYDEFVKETDLLRDIYLLRNQNHRGNKLADWEIPIDKRIKNNSTIHYFRFLDFLATFVQGIKDGFPISDELIEYSKNYTPVSILEGPKVVGKIELKDYGKKNSSKK